MQCDALCACQQSIRWSVRAVRPYLGKKVFPVRWVAQKTASREVGNFFFFSFFSFY